LRVVAPLGIVAVIALACACNEILGNADGHLVPDAGANPGTDASSAMKTDGSVPSVDAGEEDAGAIDDASTDAPALGFCASLSPAPAFCADFDDENADAGLYGFTSETSGGGCSLTRDPTASSAPLALRAVTNAVASCYLVTQVTPNQAIAIDLDVRMHALPASAGGVDGIFTLHAGNVRYSLYAAKTGVFLQGNGATTQTDSDHLPAPSLDVFHHVHMNLTLGANPIMSGTYDQTTITFGSGKPQGTAPGPYDPNTITDVRIGLTDTYLSNVGDVFIDNVVVRVQ
jgi:hypothetical protein